MPCHWTRNGPPPPRCRRSCGWPTAAPYDAPDGRTYATPAHVLSERLLLAAATTDRAAPALDHATAAAYLDRLAESGVELSADQAAAVRGILTSGAAVETLVGPAGTGKSFVVGALARAWEDPALWDGGGRQVIGLASSQIATNVLADEGLSARNIARWLATQDRLADGHAFGDDAEWQLRSGNLVVVDESAMTSTADLSAIRGHVEAAGAKLLLTGDHRQLAAVGAGGGLDLLATQGTAPSYELAETRRFTELWEGQASLRLRDGDTSVLTEYHRHGRLLDCGAVEQAERSAARAWLADSLDGDQSLLIVDTNEQAARVSAHLRAELVRLGRVAESGVPLGLQGTYAGVGDLIQTRRNARHLAGHEGNRRGPINRETFRVLEAREDGSLVVAPPAGGDRITLPADYVAEHVALGYAATAHTAQGRTVDTCHTVVTPGTGAAALYVGMSRGRHANTAHITTRPVPVDAPTGAVNEAMHRSPAVVLAAALEAGDPQRSALAEAVESAQEAEAIRTPAELLADAAELATAGRTARWLDQLTADGALRPDQRLTLAAEDGAATLTRVLRRAELAGHDPEQVLRAAVDGRSLADARLLTNVIHHRITEAVSLDPVGDSYLDWIPKVDEPQWQAYLTQLATEADTRRSELGAEVAEQASQWAVEAFGSPPEDSDALVAWTERAASVAAYRELSGNDDPAEPLGPAPKPGQVDSYAAWRAAWRALGRLEADRDELEMSDGQLRVRVRAYQREEAWAPRYVANELAGTRQAADTQRHTAALRRAEAAAAAEEAERSRLEKEATEASALADVLHQRIAQLTAADEARARWLAHTTETRVAKDRAEAELSARQAASGRDEDLITAEEWLAEHAAAKQAEDAHRVIGDESDLADVAEGREKDLAAADFAPPSPDAAALAPADIREVAAAEPRAVDEDVVRVPTAKETAGTIARAQRALAEIRERQAAEERRAAEEAAPSSSPAGTWTTPRSTGPPRSTRAAACARRGWLSVTDRNPSAGYTAADVHRYARRTPPRPIQRVDDGLQPAGPADQPPGDRATEKQGLRSEALGLDQLLVRGPTVLGDRRPLPVPAAGRGTDGSVRQPPTGNRHTGGVPVLWMLGKVALGGAPDRDELPARDVQIAHGDSSDVPLGDVHASDGGTQDRPCEHFRPASEKEHPMPHRNVQQRPRVLLSVEEAAEALAISRTSMFGYLKAGLVESVKLGHRRFVPAEAIAAYVARLVEEPPAATRQPEGK